MFLNLAPPQILAAEQRFHIDTVETAAIQSAVPSNDPKSASVFLGAYDPHDLFRHAPGIRVQHVFVYWQAVDKAMLTAKMQLAEMKARTLMVTVEPYTKAANWRDGGDHLFADILSGQFDTQIAAVCSAVADFPGDYWVRWGHEMDDPTGRYPWARRDSGGYIAAYRYFVEACREIAPRARFIWSPKGERSLTEYYPGDTYVDMIGVSVWGLETSDRAWHGGPRTFAEAFGEKYYRVEKFDKPVIVAELGVAGREVYRQNGLAEISEFSTSRDLFPLLTGIVYFNDKEPHHWPDGYGAPDWRVTTSDLSDGRPSDVSPRQAAVHLSDDRN
ncbi:beta-mannosidase [Mesorhizobium camelthorni]|uniref:Beta-mannosidase n=2 Tax=Allomesorhizobium camelthorni TaxID=475069 RepID=A0A6G4WKK0_9HYPH|nr:beta-mannosidase [Mesorhizobium camelthorni]